ncbi:MULTISPECIES: glycosyltransferase [Micromonospora]|uniref:glycosyltransferase n=1 Tax=Micromonospora TaxID=1873 RepID=UPI0005C43622|nr:MULTISPECIES: glycosyltransferase [Micromonospora]
MTTNGPWVAYIAPFPFPWGSAAARRVFGIAASLATGGHHVVVLTSQSGGPDLSRVDGPDGPGSISTVGFGGTVPASAGMLRRAKRSLVADRALLRWLAAQPTPPSHVLLYGVGADRTARVRRWCRNHRVPLIADVVEWYDPWHLPGGPLGLSRLSNELVMRYHHPRCDGVIAISSYLENYYRRRTRVIRVPPTLDVAALEVAGRREGGDPAGLHLVYSGVPGRKDLIGRVIEAVDRVSQDGVDVVLNLCGPSADEVRRLLGGRAVPPSVRLRGSLSQQEIPAIIRQADFSVILRRDARYAHAGFPTKFCESLANGTPVITNLTSDLGSYLRDGQEGLVCRDDSVDALRLVLAAAARLDPARRGAMREAARRQARASFDYRNFTGPLSAFLDETRRPATTVRREPVGDGALNRR